MPNITKPANNVNSRDMHTTSELSTGFTFIRNQQPNPSGADLGWD